VAESFNGDWNESLCRFSHDAMATTFEICLLYENSVDAEQASLAAFEEIDWIEQQISYFIPSSDVARINRLSAGESLRVGIAAYECVALAKRLFDETDGAFDITAGALLDGRRPWDENAEVPLGVLPPEIDGPVHIGMDLLVLQAETLSVGVLSDNVAIDLGGVGKGYAVDQAKKVLHDWGVETAFVSAGQSTMSGIGDGGFAALARSAAWITG
jgi:thiamine biosynthesis lipoprotein